MPNRRKTDLVTDEMINEVANNGYTQKQLVSKMYLENKIEHKEIFTKINFCNKFMWTCIVILVTAFIGGLITIIVQTAQQFVGG